MQEGRKREYANLSVDLQFDLASRREQSRRVACTGCSGRPAGDISRVRKPIQICFPQGSGYRSVSATRSQPEQGVVKRAKADATRQIARSSCLFALRQSCLIQRDGTRRPSLRRTSMKAKIALKWTIGVIAIVILVGCWRCGLVVRRFFCLHGKRRRTSAPISRGAALGKMGLW